MTNKYHHLYQRDINGRYVPVIATELAERFADKVDKSHRDNGCWLWTGTVTNRGYGKISLGGATSGEVLAHRLSWEMANKKTVPQGMYVLHHCDNPLCVRPDHLFAGSQADNIHDMMSKGRGCHPNPASGERNGNSKLIVTQVLGIRKLLASGMSASSVGKRYGVRHSTVLNIRNRVTWVSVE